MPTPYLALVLRYWKAGLAALLLLALAVQTVRVGNLKDDLASCELAKKWLVQAGETRKQRAKVAAERAAKNDSDADNRARRIEEAPLPGDCVSPDEVMGADL